MISRDTSPIVQRLIYELAEADREMLSADRQLQQAQADYEIASVKFVALRDMLASRIGRSPYALPYYSNNTLRLVRDGEPEVVELPSGGRFRFYRIPPGDAVETALIGIDEPMALYRLTNILRDGGADWATPRAVNAAITNKVGKTVGKTDEGTYFLLNSFLNLEPTGEEFPFNLNEEETEFDILSVSN